MSTTSLEIAEQKTQASPPQLADGPLYVVGIWRSGTSLFYALLNQHPQIALTYEDDLVFLRPIFWLPRKTASWLARWDFFNGAVVRHKIDTSRIPENISDLKAASDAVHVQYARQKKTATIWGCKSPTYFDMLSDIGATFPKAKFIIIWRDLRGICRSIAKAAEGPSFFRRKGIMLRALLGYRQMKLQCDRLLADGAPVYQIYYEDLVSDPTAVMKGVCEFLQIPFDKRMTLLEGADRSAIDDGKHHSMVKSTAIRGVRDRSDSLPPALDAKIDRYSRLWREQEGGNWPAYPERPEGDLSKPSIWEINYDRICYWALWFSYYMIPVVYSFVPLNLWKKYRQFNGKSFSWEKLKKDASSD